MLTRCCPRSLLFVKWLPGRSSLLKLASHCGIFRQSSAVRSHCLWSDQLASAPNDWCYWSSGECACWFGSLCPGMARQRTSRHSQRWLFRSFRHRSWRAWLCSGYRYHHPHSPRRPVPFEDLERLLWIEARWYRSTIACPSTWSRRSCFGWLTFHRWHCLSLYCFFVVAIIFAILRLWCCFCFWDFLQQCFGVFRQCLLPSFRVGCWTELSWRSLKEFHTSAIPSELPGKNKGIVISQWWVFQVTFWRPHWWVNFWLEKVQHIHYKNLIYGHCTV